MLTESVQGYRGFDYEMNCWILPCPVHEVCEALGCSLETSFFRRGYGDDFWKADRNLAETAKVQERQMVGTVLLVSTK